MKKFFSSRLFNILIIAIPLPVVIGYIIWRNGLNNVVTLFKTANIWWLIFAVFLMCLYWLLESVILHIPLKFFHPEQVFKETLRTSMLGQFFNCITPSTTGGQPIQAFYLGKTGVSVGKASSALLMKFIIYQIALTVYTAVIVLFFPHSLTESSAFKYLFIIGFIVNLVIAFILVSSGLMKSIPKKIVRGIITLLSKLRIVKDKDKQFERADREIDAFNGSFKLIIQKKGILLFLTFLSILQLTSFFLIPYAIYKAFGLIGTSWLTMIAASSFVTVASAFIPLPGGSGGAELGFVSFFGKYFSQNTVGLALLLWRLITFYLPIGIGIVLTSRLLGKQFLRQKPQNSENSEI